MTMTREKKLSRVEEILCNYVQVLNQHFQTVFTARDFDHWIAGFIAAATAHATLTNEEAALFVEELVKRDFCKNVVGITGTKEYKSIVLDFKK